MIILVKGVKSDNSYFIAHVEAKDVRTVETVMREYGCGFYSETNEDMIEMLELIGFTVVTKGPAVDTIEIPIFD